MWNVGFAALRTNTKDRYMNRQIGRELLRINLLAMHSAGSNNDLKLGVRWAGVG